MAYPRGELGSGAPHFSKICPRDLYKNIIKFFKESIFPYTRELEGREPKISRGYTPRPPPTTRVLDMPLRSANIAALIQNISNKTKQASLSKKEQRKKDLLDFIAVLQTNHRFPPLDVLVVKFRIVNQKKVDVISL